MTVRSFVVCGPELYILPPTLTCIKKLNSKILYNSDVTENYRQQFRILHAKIPKEMLVTNQIQNVNHVELFD